MSRTNSEQGLLKAKVGFRMPNIEAVTISRKTQATIRILSQLASGERAGREKGWLAIEEATKALEVSDDTGPK